MITANGFINRNPERFSVVVDGGPVLTVEGSVYLMKDNAILIKARPLDAAPEASQRGELAKLTDSSLGDGFAVSPVELREVSFATGLADLYQGDAEHF